MGNRGFTLFEILIVLIIVGVMSGLIMLSLPGRSDAERIEAAAARVAALIEHQCNEALLLNRTVRMQVDDRGYRFSVRTREGWSPLRDDTFRDRAWPIPLTASLRLDSPPGDEDGIYCRPTGELSSFELRLVSQNGSSTGLRGTASGAIERQGGPG